MPNWREFKARSKRAKIHLSITIVLLVLCVILASLLGRYFKKDPEHELCHTKQCVAAAHHILSFIDESVDPCDNFYKFMCGNYIANHTYDHKGLPTSRQFNFENVKHQMLSEKLDRDNPSSNANYNYQMSNFEKKRMFYRKCLNVSEIEQDNDKIFRDDLTKVMGGWPLKDWQLRNVNSWKDVMLRARENGIKYDFFFNIDVYHNESEHTFHIEISPPSEDYMTGPVFSNIFKRENIDTILKMAKYWSKDSVRISSDDLEEAIIFAKNLSNNVVESNRKRESGGNAIKFVSISDLDKYLGSDLYPDWMEFLKNFTNIASLKKCELVAIKFASNYFEQMVNLVNRANSYVWMHYVALNMIYDDCPYLSSTMRHLCMSSLPRPEVMDDRKTICSAAVDRFDAVEHAMDVEYVRRMNNPEINVQAEEIFVSVREALLRNLHANHFSNKSYFDQVYKYFKGIAPVFGWSKMVFDVNKYNQYYALKPAYDIRGTQVLQLRRHFEKSIMNSKFRTLKDKYHLWDNTTNVPTVDFNAFYNYLEKTIYIQTPLLLEPTFGINRSQCLNYGTLGHLIGHEFMHALEAAVMMTPEEWRQSGSKSWQNQLLQVREEEWKCILDAYYNRRKNSSGVLDLDASEGEFKRKFLEALADFGGMKFAYAGYENYTETHPGEEMMLPGLKYTPRQLFWIMSGSYMCEKRTVEQSVPRKNYTAWSPYYSELRFHGQSFRVNAPRMNHPGFLEDFKCKPGDKMYPTKTCDIMI